jgi:hypothetical protein
MSQKHEGDENDAKAEKVAQGVLYAARYRVCAGWSGILSGGALVMTVGNDNMSNPSDRPRGLYAGGMRRVYEDCPDNRAADLQRRPEKAVCLAGEGKPVLIARRRFSAFATATNRYAAAAMPSPSLRSNDR